MANLSKKYAMSQPETNSRISIVIPTLNEEENISRLIKRIDAALQSRVLAYEIIFIDDHSADRTREIIKSLENDYPVFCYLKKGKRGKAHSLLEGFSHAQYDLIAMIDADMQYPPEALPLMIEKIKSGSDIVVANRTEKQVGFSRKISGETFEYLFGRFLHGLHCDVQSGLKVFKKSILKEIVLHPTPWTFDLEFLVKARNAGHSIGTVDIEFEKRQNGQSKINFIQATWEIGINALTLKLRKKIPSLIHPESSSSMIGAGLAHNQTRFITHTTRPHHASAIETFTRFQKTIFVFIIVAVILGFAASPYYAAIALMAALSAIYFFDVLFNLYLVMKSLHTPPEIGFSKNELTELDGQDLPMYSILCPLYKEVQVLPIFLKAISDFDWPKDRLDAVLLLEQDDEETIAAAKAMDLPTYVRTLIVPHSLPKTKPKACNYGLSFAKGEYVVIYDAEDIPEPEQLKKAYLGFKSSPADVKCLQAKLNYYNPRQNLLTRFFTAEYSLWFDVILTGLQTLNTSIPLGGTSNHFRTADLLELEGWDPFNVTEDCDLGIRLFKKGYKTAVIDSITLEEANSHVGNWIRQRSRWIKGYMQTYLVHMRKPSSFIRENGIHAFVFQLTVGGKVAFLFINPILWAATISYFALYAIVGPAIESLYPPIVFYMAVFSLVFGNFLCIYYYMIGCAKREHWGLIKYVFLIPAYWLMASIAAFVALYQLIVKPHFWEKTRHGLHFKRMLFEEKQNQPDIAARPESTADSQPSEVSFARSFLRQIIPKEISKGAGFLVISMMAANFLNFLFNAFLGRVLGFEELGLIVLVNTLWMVASIFIGAVSSTVNHRTAMLAASGNNKGSTHFLNSVLKKSAIVAILFTILIALLSQHLSVFFHIQNPLIFLSFSPILIFGVIAAVNGGYLNGNLLFAHTGSLILIESVSKFTLAGIFVALGFNELVYLSIPFSILCAAIASMYFVSRKKEAISGGRMQPFPIRFYAAALMTGVSATVFLTVDIILVKHFLPPAAAGQYVLLALAGKIIYFLGSLPNAFMISLVSRDLGMRRDTKRNFRIIFGAVLALTCVGFLMIGPFGRIIVPLLFGNKAAAILPYLIEYSAAIVMFTLANSFAVYHLAKKQYLFPSVSFIFSVLMAIGIAANHGAIGDVVNVLFIVSAALFGIMAILHFSNPQLPFIGRLFIDFKDAFFSIPQAIYPSLDKKSILIFNWRDTRHILAGGAENYVYELAKHWTYVGHNVTVFCGNDGRSPRQEIIDGVRIIRRGGFYFVYFWAFLYYWLQFRGKYDVIIDSQNGVPFFTPLYAKEPIYSLMHHVHQKVFWHSLPKHLAFIASTLEKHIMPLAYRNTKFITVSESSKQAMKDLGLGRAGIEIVYPGIDLAGLVPGDKSKTPTVLYLGRLKAYKSIAVLIRAFASVAAAMPSARLIIAGSGEEEIHLKNLTRDLTLGSQIEFLGKVSEVDKINLLQKAWVFVNPSLMEGWGITTLEANACGTPVIASDVPGLRDSVKNSNTGYLVPYGETEELSNKIIELLRDQGKREQMSRQACDWAKQFDWEKSSEQFLSAIIE